MSARHSLARWFRGWGSRKPARQSDDFADLGTAYGLDLSLQFANDQRDFRQFGSTPPPEPIDKQTPG
jgi:hypothetical protein